jgi:hypothetical protein
MGLEHVVTLSVVRDGQCSMVSVVSTGTLCLTTLLSNIYFIMNWDVMIMRDEQERSGRKLILYWHSS